MCVDVDYTLKKFNFEQKYLCQLHTSKKNDDAQKKYIYTYFLYSNCFFLNAQIYLLLKSDVIYLITFLSSLYR
jgi:hypothetical protein